MRQISNPTQQENTSTAEIIELESLHYLGEGHDKIWVGAIIKLETGQYTYMAAWGRRGAAMQSLRREPSSMNNASAEFNAKVYEKERKGYQRVSADMYGIRQSITDLVNAFASKGETIVLWSRPTSLIFTNIAFSPEGYQTNIQDTNIGFVQAVQGERKLVEIIPGQEPTAQASDGTVSTLPPGINVLSGLSFQVLLDGIETDDGKFAIVDIYELHSAPINWLPLTARLAMLEKEAGTNNVPVTFHHTIEQIRDKGVGVLSATFDTATKIDMANTLPKLGSTGVFLRNMMGKFEPRANIQLLDLSPIL